MAAWSEPFDEKIRWCLYNGDTPQNSPPRRQMEWQSEQACLRPRDRFWDIPVPKIDSAFDNLLVPQPSWSPSTTQQLRKLVAAPYLAPNDWTPRSEAYFVFPLAQGTPGKQCGLAATGVYQPSLRSPWLAAVVGRDVLREDPPPILVTNATMLEYMLVRNVDRPIIDQSQG
ncbi:hypothetical protein, partial [Thiolapillus sp.]|uniref:hypothetical protein n=1 Tax=Thiolapillus sp. TaxID=2017437 RepID=UPI003AF454D6